jgi:hypothetical protein
MGDQVSYRGNGVNLGNPNVIIPALTAILFVFLVGISLYIMLYDVTISSDVVIVKDVKDLVEIFQKIDKKCKILDFEHQKICINFLTVKGFASSEVGSIDLAYPTNWEGPYVQDNPEIQGKEYQIVRTKKGYFITPGDGVKLSNGKVVGKDIVLDEKADIAKMMQDPKFLNFNGKPLAAPLPIGSRRFSKVMMDNIIRADDDFAKGQESHEEKLFQVALAK